ncbi:MAG: NYN domain-containing protein [Anaerolineaceae bacterium]|jgi:uncharacterized LabA/DUF88 family protein|nr:NYN domain-containing protein [Anaerolineaceae bacterium]
MEKIITYIDGFNLYHGIKSKYGNKFKWLDIEELSNQFLQPQQSLEKVYYFTAMISKNPPKEYRQKTYISAINSLSKVKIVLGKYLVNPHRCPNCGSIEQIPSEKMTDVNIANQLLVDAFLDKYDVAILVSADSDLTGPVKQVTNLFPRKKVVVAFPPDRVSFDLKQVASAFVYISRRKLEVSQFPLMVISKDGTTIKKPRKWNGK